jgi:hypothetical protein
MLSWKGLFGQISLSCLFPDTINVGQQTNAEIVIYKDKLILYGNLQISKSPVTQIDFIQNQGKIYQFKNVYGTLWQPLPSNQQIVTDFNLKILAKKILPKNLTFHVLFTYLFIGYPGYTDSYITYRLEEKNGRRFYVLTGTE